MQMTRDRAVQVTLPNDTEILITREFDAPPELVYRVFTEPELVRRWWTAKRGEMTVCEIDLRVGGRWRYAMLAHGEFEVAFHGEYLELEPGRRIVSTEVYEAAPHAAATGTTTFTEHGAGTLLTIRVEHANRADRDAHIESGMEDGLQDALGLVDEVLETIA